MPMPSEGYQDVANMAASPTMAFLFLRPISGKENQETPYSRETREEAELLGLLGPQARKQKSPREEKPRRVQVRRSPPSP
jgi:hypothetical protein